MYYIVGLGNPGDDYRATRHNVGWLVLDQFCVAQQLPQAVASARYAGRVSEGVVKGGEITVLYPDTFMNHSGSAVRKLVPKGEADHLVVIYDDVDLPLGEHKVSFGRGSGGHNGIASIINSLGTADFIRVRVGIAPKSFWNGATKRPAGAKLPKYVLAPFTKAELAKVRTVGETVNQIIATIVTEGYVAAMNRFN